MMKFRLLILLCFVIVNLQAQSKREYLENNRFDLTNKGFEFPESNFRIVGFGAYHGSAKTESTEIALLKALVNQRAVKYYLPETDYSIGHFFNEYLETGDSILLKDLVMHYGIRVPQEKSIAVYEKWKKIKAINDKLVAGQKLKVVGLDYQVSFKYAALHIIQLINSHAAEQNAILEMKKMVQSDTTDFQSGYNGYARSVMKNFIESFDLNPNLYLTKSNKQKLQHIIKNLKIVIEPTKGKREPTILANYIELDQEYDFKTHPQFMRIGFSHLMKSREGPKGYPYFFTLLIEKNICKKEELITIIGYLTKSEVLWDATYDKKGNYNGYTTEAGYGIGDYWKEYFKGIKHLKKSKLSDNTLFKLNGEHTPYHAPEPDLIEVKMIFSKSNKKSVSEQSTTSFIDYAVLIENSKAAIPLEAMK